MRFPRFPISGGILIVAQALKKLNYTLVGAVRCYVPAY